MSNANPNIYSSLKFQLYTYSNLELHLKGSASNIGNENASLKLTKGDETLKEQKIGGEDHAEIWSDIQKLLQDQLGSLDCLRAISHRIVHGGEQREPLVITKDSTKDVEQMDRLSSFAPLHNHHAVLVVKSRSAVVISSSYELNAFAPTEILETLPETQNVLCFDTLFHQTLTPATHTYAIGKPPHETPLPLRRFGFHGLSYASILKSTAKFLKKDEKSLNLIVCHLGSGASMCCIEKGKSVDTTVGCQLAVTSHVDQNADGTYTFGRYLVLSF